MAIPLPVVKFKVFFEGEQHIISFPPFEENLLGSLFSQMLPDHGIMRGEILRLSTFAPVTVTRAAGQLYVRDDIVHVKE